MVKWLIGFLHGAIVTGLWVLTASGYGEWIQVPAFLLSLVAVGALIYTVGKEFPMPNTPLSVEEVWELTAPPESRWEWDSVWKICPHCQGAGCSACMWHGGYMVARLLTRGNQP